MNKTISIRVTTQDIKAGQPCSYSQCPIAKAARRHFKKRDIGVCDDGHINIGENEYISQQDKAKKFITNFDRSKRRHLCRPTTLKIQRLTREDE